MAKITFDIILKRLFKSIPIAIGRRRLLLVTHTCVSPVHYMAECSGGGEHRHFLVLSCLVCVYVVNKTGDTN